MSVIFSYRFRFSIKVQKRGRTFKTDKIQDIWLMSNSNNVNKMYFQTSSRKEKLTKEANDIRVSYPIKKIFVLLQIMSLFEKMV